MKKQTWKKGLAAMLGLMLSVQAPAVGLTPSTRAYAYTERSATVNATSLNVRSGAGTSHSQVTKLAKGAAVTVIGETTDSEGKLWYQIRFTASGGSATTGYALSTYIKFPVAYSHDSSFESQMSSQGFPDSYKDALRQIHAQYPNWTFTAQQTGLDWNTVIQNEGVLGRNLVHKNSISSFKSIVDGAYNWDNGSWTGFDGSTWVAASEEILRYYMDPRNALDEVSVFQFLSQEYDANIHTKEGLVSMLKGTFMEGNVRSNGSAAGSSGAATGSGTGSATGPGPGSSGNTAPGGQSAVVVAPSGNQDNAGQNSSQAPESSGSGVVTFESPQASISKHRTALVGSSAVVVSGGPGSVSDGSSSGSQGAASPTTGVSDGTVSSVSYADVIMQAAAESGVNPYVIAAMIIQEQGSDGRGNSISGNHGSYSGYYNYFNVGAYASDGMSAVERGLWYASQSGTYGRPWNTPEKAILGGAQFYGSNYVKAGQDTLYLKKYNVQGSNIYKHQYMTNVDGASAEGSIFAEGFSAALKSTALNFKIPVYSNMPATACVQPTVDGSPNNKLSALGAEGFVLTPTFNKDTTSYDLIVDHSVGNVTIQASAIDSKATVRGAGNIQLQSGNNEISVVVRAENGTERNYAIHVVRQTNGPTYNAGVGGGTVPGGTSSGDTTGGPSSVVTVGPGGSSSGGGAANTSPSPAGSSGNVVTPGGSNVTVVSPVS
ncbi:MAG: SH3 domain-containing protein [Lachnospiraceae bacterium]|nr:SH3 domain-containing protein [Lachnospiraceae bacterium]